MWTFLSYAAVFGIGVFAAYVFVILAFARGFRR
jgi:hypothetical protein